MSNNKYKEEQKYYEEQAQRKGKPICYRRQINENQISHTFYYVALPCGDTAIVKYQDNHVSRTKDNNSIIKFNFGRGRHAFGSQRPDIMTAVQEYVEKV